MQVTGVTVLADWSNPDGSFHYGFQWVTDPQADGHIVQHIDRREFDANHNQVELMDYWEAWRVRHGEVLGRDGSSLANAAHDSWSGKPEPGGTSVLTVYVATVYWSDDFDPTVENWGSGVGYAGDLWSSLNAPAQCKIEYQFQHAREFRYGAALTAQDISLMLRRWMDDDMFTPEDLSDLITTYGASPEAVEEAARLAGIGNTQPADSASEDESDDQSGSDDKS